jgi:hypothetical protein
MYIVRTNHPTLPYVTAPSGYCRTGPDSIARDGTCPVRSSPEYGLSPWRFKSRLSAARQATKCCGRVESI